MNAVIIGGGPVGCDLALDLCDKGKDVTIVEMLPKLLKKPAISAPAEGTAIEEPTPGFWENLFPDRPDNNDSWWDNLFPSNP